MEGMTALIYVFRCVSRNQFSFPWGVSAVGDYIP